jgi:hypothetical protein
MSSFDFEKTLKLEEKILNSKENLERCIPFQEEQSRLISLAKSYAIDIQKIYQKAEESIVSREYSKGGQSLHRGYYSPSPIIDLVVGNISRGRLIKNLKKERTFHYEYGFDSNKKLLIVKSFYENKIELIECLNYNNDIVLGLTFDQDYEIVQICECKYYNGNIVQLKDTGCYVFDDSFPTFEKQIYTYGKEGIQFVDMYTYENNIHLIKHMRHEFMHNTEGYLSSYKTIEYRGEVVVPGYWDGHEFEIKKKRKV